MAMPAARESLTPQTRVFFSTGCPSLSAGSCSLGGARTTGHSCPWVSTRGTRASAVNSLPSRKPSGARGCETDPRAHPKVFWDTAPTCLASPEPPQCSSLCTNHRQQRPSQRACPTAARPCQGVKTWHLLFTGGRVAGDMSQSLPQTLRTHGPRAAVLTRPLLPAHAQPSWAHFRKVGMSRTGTLRVSALTRRFRSSVSSTTSLSRRIGSSGMEMGRFGGSGLRCQCLWQSGEADRLAGTAPSQSAVTCPLLHSTGAPSCATSHAPVLVISPRGHVLDPGIVLLEP